MPRLVAASVKGPRKFWLLAVLVGASALLYLAQRAEATPYNGPFFTTTSASPRSPVSPTASLRDYNDSESPYAAPVTTTIKEDCPKMPMASYIGIDLVDGALRVDLTNWISGTRGDHGGGMSLRSASPLGGATQFGCFPWIPSFETTVQSINGGATVLLRDNQGDIETWTKNGAVYVGPAGSQNTLTQPGGTNYRLTDQYGNYIDFDVRGMPATLTDRNGNVTTYNYNANYETTSIVDDRGRTTTLTHNALHAVTSVTDPDGHVWT